MSKKYLNHAVHRITAEKSAGGLNMRKIRNIRKDDAVSPVIATILMVAITVVLAAVLYVMVMGMTNTNSNIQTPLGLNQKAKTSTNVTLLVSNAPNGAKVDGTTISYTHAGSPGAITSAKVYDAAGAVAATYSSGTWTYSGSYTADNLNWESGMMLEIKVGSVSSGDGITISSSSNTFGTTTVTVN